MNYTACLSYEDREGGIPLREITIVTSCSTEDPSRAAFEWLFRTRPEMASNRWRLLAQLSDWDHVRRVWTEPPEGRWSYGTQQVGPDRARCVLRISPA